MSCDNCGPLKKGQKLVFKATILNCSDVAIDVSTATTIEFTFRKPSKEIVTVTGTLYTDGTDGIIKYTVTSTSFLDEVGMWQVEGYVILSGGDNFHTQKYTFRVEANLDGL